MGFNDDIIAEFRANDGKVGGNFEGAPILLLHHQGVKSGKKYIAPLVYQAGNDGVTYVFASFAGAPEDPQWFRNLKATPDTSVEIGTETIAVTASEVTGADRDRIWAQQASVMPGFSDYEKKTTRVIPVVALTPA
ncbi:nitroreductase family deazaflavin-dependent oxidoreductase [Williamsia sp.]|uniref:nitroreductase family deazaflavin-dependent oxidoreductase n=1 Tax=Williamsia sp. TaxID=1872085 RepID=UPI002F950AE3